MQEIPENIDRKIWTSIIACVARERRERQIPLTLSEITAIREDDKLESQRKRGREC